MAIQLWPFIPAVISLKVSAFLCRMDGGSRIPGRGILGSIDEGPRSRYIIVLSVLYLASLAAMAIWGRSWGAYKGLFGLWFIIYICLLYHLASSEILSRMEKIDPKWIILGFFLISLLLYLPFLLEEPGLSQDILRLERRGELIMDGRFPYRDFDVNKPPLYIWMVGAISLPFGPDQIAFRIVFVIASSFVPVVMYFIHRSSGGNLDLEENTNDRKYQGMNWLFAAVGYMLCPIVLLEIGSGGHFDPVVVLCTVLSFLFLIKKRSLISGIALGTGFALKLYPMFIAPIFFLSYTRWRDRLLFTAGFFIPTLLSVIPLLIVDPSLVIEYMDYQFYGWTTGISLRGSLEGMLDTIGLPTDIAYYILTGVLFFSIVFFSIKGFTRKIGRYTTLWIFILLASFSLMGVLLSTAYMKEYEGSSVDTFLGFTGILLSIMASSIGLYLFLSWIPKPFWSPRRVTLKGLFTMNIGIEMVPFLSTCVLMVLILTSAQFHPWYITWILPFLLTSGDSNLTWSLLLILSTFQINGYLPWDILSSLE